jgi:hypothetical protein
LNSAQIGSADLASATEIQAIVDAWTLVLNPDDRSTDANEAAFETIGLFAAGDNASVSSKLSGLIASMSVESIDTLTELNDLSNQSNRVDFLGFDINEDGDYTDDYEIAINGVVGFDDSDNATGDNAFDLYLDVSDASDGDIIELYVDGELLYTSSALTASDISNGTYVVDAANLDLSSKDTTGAAGSNAVADDDRVELELKVKLADSTYVQDDTSWEYQW